MAEGKEGIYQERYVQHQAKKKAQLAPTDGETEWRQYTDEERAAFFAVLENRRTQRTFNSAPVTQEEMDRIAEAMSAAPSSCNRQAVYGKVISERDDKELLSGLLVGGVGWSQRADKIVLLFADKRAYKSPAEQDFMPYLDAGAMIMTMYMATEAMGVGAAYINPNIRETNQELFTQRFGGENLVFCGAMALGHYDTRVNASPRRTARDVWLK